MLNNVIAMGYIVENPEYKTSHKDPEKEISYIVLTSAVINRDRFKFCVNVKNWYKICE